jgi:uncharacterized MAPEG superfamily protein
VLAVAVEPDRLDPFKKRFNGIEELVAETFQAFLFAVLKKIMGQQVSDIRGSRD